MRFHRPLDDFLGNRTAVRLLRVLSRSPGKEFTGRELAIEAGVSGPDAGRELSRLLAQDAVVRRTVGRAHLWRWSETHYLTEALAALFEAEDDARKSLGALIRRELASAEGLERLVLFGSVARGDEVPSSDIDLLVVVTDDQAKQRITTRLGKLRVMVGRAFGNSLSPIVYSVEEVRRKKRLPLFEKADEEGIVILDRNA